TLHAGPLLGFKEGLHVYGSMAVSALGCPYLGLKTFKQIHPIRTGSNKKKQKQGDSRLVVQASLIKFKKPLMWVGSLCLLYSLVKILGPQSNFLSDVEGEKRMPKWLKNMLSLGSETQTADERRKMVSKWHATTKGTLKRSYRVPMKSVGRHLLKAISSLLSDDDTFCNGTYHK
ncbi:hypothetical protein KI387_023944, partial [Taxus chinensis]